MMQRQETYLTNQTTNILGEGLLRGKLNSSIMIKDQGYRELQLLISDISTNFHPKKGNGI